MTDKINPILEIKNLDFYYGQLQVLNNVSLKIFPGELVAIKGPSGSGKSTLLAMIGCLLRSTHGEIIIDGMSTGSLDQDQLSYLRNKKLGFVFQQFHLLPRMSILDNVLLPTLYPVELNDVNITNDAKQSHNNDYYEKKAYDLIELLGLQDRIDHIPNELSGGQQQRVAIARALIRDPKILLMDEPTGNLDSQSSQQIMNKVRELHQQGKTIIIITHDQEVADLCDHIYDIRDGKIIKSEVKEGLLPELQIQTEAQVQTQTQTQTQAQNKKKQTELRFKRNYWQLFSKLIPLVLRNLGRNKTRSFLTMLGITIGVAAVLTMVTLGSYTKKKILDSYAELGVNTIMFHGYPNWKMKATDRVSVMYRFFDWEKDILPLKRIFPQLKYLSPFLINWNQHKVMFGGKVVDQDVRVHGVNHLGLTVANRAFLYGGNFSPYHITNRSPVCIIGFDISERLFSQQYPIGKVMQVSEGDTVYGCKVIGVLKSAASKETWIKPNFQIYLPYTYFQAISEWWYSQIKEVLMQVRDGADIEKMGHAIEYFFNQKYGKSGVFQVNTDSKLIGQMKKFLNLFTIMLGAIALVSLIVGGIGITNMMLVSVTERFREIGLRKALGATDFSIRVQFLMESLFLCFIAGMIGLLIGFTTYQLIIYGASKFTNKIIFEWVFDEFAFSLSFLSIFFVGILSGLMPAVKAEKLQVIEALRSE